MDTKRDYNVPAVSRALDILEFLCTNGEASFTGIYTQTGLPKSSAYQILSTLERRGYVRHGGESNKYSLGLRLFELGTQAVSYLEIRTEAMPTLRELLAKTNETCNLGILDGTVGAYLAKLESTQPIRLNSYEGKRLPLHSTAMGKALLAWQKENLDKLLQHIELTRFTENTIVEKEKLKENLQLVRDRGWALDDQENEPHIRCVGAPVWDIEGKVCGAISVSGLATRFDGEYLLKLSKDVMTAAKELSEKIGGGPGTHG
jgi:IclR family KDG regulon transcriptional repressor